MSERKFVMLVDDDPAIADLYRIGLEAEGYRVLVLPHAIALSEKVSSEKPDVLILDWELPGVRGDDALEEVRLTDHGRDLPVFILSNFSGTSNGVIDRVFALGAIAWLQKVNTPPTRLAVRLKEAVGTSGQLGRR